MNESQEKINERDQLVDFQFKRFFYLFYEDKSELRNEILFFPKMMRGIFLNYIDQVLNPDCLKTKKHTKLEPSVNTFFTFGYLSAPFEYMKEVILENTSLA